MTSTIRYPHRSENHALTRLKLLRVHRSRERYKQVATSQNRNRTVQFFFVLTRQGQVRDNNRKHMDIASNPSNTVSSADKATGVPRVGIGVVVLNHENHILIGKRKSPHGQGSPSPPFHRRSDIRNMVIARRTTQTQLN